MEYKDYYKIMGVERNAPPEELKRSYRKLARKYHPDVSKEPQAEDRFKELGEAYEVLRDPEKRAAYDQLGANWRAGQDFKPPPSWDNESFSFDGGFTEENPEHFSDFFESLFGGGQFHHAGQQHRRHSYRGEDVHAKINISLEEAYQGVTRSIQLEVPEIDAHGRRHTKLRTLNVKIPAGVLQGQKIRLTGQGSPGSDANKPGDLYLEIEFLPHPLYRPEGRDIYITVPITPWEAALGGKISVPTLGGKVDLKIPANSQTSQKLRLKGRGLSGKHPGDQYVQLQIATPKADTPEQKALYEKMSQEMPFNPRANLEVQFG